MSRSTLRIVIVLAALSIAGVAITQVYWVRKAFDLKENQFNRDVGTALRGVAERIFIINKTPSPANNPVEQLTTNNFKVTINGPIDNQLLQFLLTTEFEKRNIGAQYEYCVYDCVDKCVNNGIASSAMPVVYSPKSKDGYYFVVHFTQVEANLLSQMGIWGFSSAVLLLVIAFFTYTLFVILKQRRLSEVQKDFINNMTHEFKTPLSTIAISAGVLKDQQLLLSPERLLNYATIIETENNRLRLHVDRVLQVASLDRKDIGIQRERVDLHEIIAAAVKNISLALRQKQGHIELHLDADSFTVSGDKLHLTNIIFNLLDNAIKYTVAAPSIRIATQTVNKSIVTTIADNGIGIPREQFKRVFERFYRIPTGNVHNTKGFGLGLNYVRMMAEAHGGTISIQSTPGKGSVFTLILPITI